MEAVDASGTTCQIDFMDETNFEQFIEFIRGETADPIVKLCPNSNYNCEHIHGCLDDHLFGPIPGELFDDNDTTNMSDLNSILNWKPGNLGGVEEENDGEEESSSATTTPTMRGMKKVDRSRTLISERRRRGRMKEKLYALRSLVPNITKMDKASIVADAVLYVQELQIQAKKLKAEIAGLQSSLTLVDKDQGGSYHSARKIQVLNTHLICKNIVQMEVFQVEERGFYVRLVCNKGQGVATSLYKALESLTSFIVQSSNLATAAENFTLTLTLNVRESEVNINLPNLKLWVAGAFLNQGFEFKTSPLPYFITS